jgi:hypothetical protein
MSDIRPTERQDDSKEATELALKRFDIVMRYFIYENGGYWTRNQFFLVANAGLFAVFAAVIREEKADGTVIAVLGLFLSGLWRVLLKSSEYWTHRWEKICCLFETQAFGETEVFRNCRPKKFFSTKKSAHIAANTFIFLWLVCFLNSGWDLWTLLHRPSLPPCTTC